MVNFEDHFWGDKYNGFDVLQQNFKLGFNASKEFTDFLKERSSIEETYAKALLKLATKCSTANSHIGCFEPCWKFLQSSTEKLANVHTKVIQNLNEVSKTCRDYGEQHKEKQKQMKDDFTATSEAVLNFQSLSTNLVKAKESYQQKSVEVEKHRKDFTNLKDIKNAEMKFKKSSEDYKNLVEKREEARQKFHEIMTEIARKLQKEEEYHLIQMLDILSKYGETIKLQRFLFDQIIDEFSRNMIALTVENLLQQFIDLKGTGKEIPDVVDFEELELKSEPVNLDAIAQAIKEEKKKKKEEKRQKKVEKLEQRKKKKEKVSANGSVETSDGNIDLENVQQVDEEGYVIRRPADSESLNSGQFSKDSVSSESDTDSEDERQKIQVRIKPMEETKGSSNPDLSEEQLKKLSATLTLMRPTAQEKLGKTIDEKKFVSLWGSHNSLNNYASKSRSNNDLLDIEKNSDTASLRSLPVGSTIGVLDRPTSGEDTPTSYGENNGSINSNNFEGSFSMSPMASPKFTSSLPGSRRISPSTSFEKSNELSDVVSKNLEEQPPPLPLKNRSQSTKSNSNSLPSSECSEQSSESNKNNSESAIESDVLVVDQAVFPNSDFTVDSSEGNVFSDSNKSLGASPSNNNIIDSIDKSEQNSVSENTKLSLEEEINTELSNRQIKTFSNDLFKPDSFIATPPSPKLDTKSSIEPLNPPPLLNKRSGTLPSTHTALGRNAQAATASLPRPKGGQITGPPSLPRRLISPSTTTAGPTTSNSFSDLLDINFSSNVPPLSPMRGNSTSKADVTESTTAHWVNPEVSGDDEISNETTSSSVTRNDTPPIQTIAVTTSASSLTNIPSNDRVIPIAVAFIETVNGLFKGADDKSCVIRVTGDMTISFPANIITILSNNPNPPVLSFLVTGTSSLEQVFPNKALVERGGQLVGGEGITFKFNMPALVSYLKKQAERGNKATYYNIDIIKYQVRCKGMSSAPLQLSAYWRCDEEETDLRIDYQYNQSCMSSITSLNNVSFVVPIDGGVTIMQSKPTAIWSSEHQRCMWKLAAISSSFDSAGFNSLRARFNLSRGPTSPSPIAVQFTGEGSTISLLNFDLTSPAYKLSLVKKRFTSGKYVVDQ